MQIGFRKIARGPGWERWGILENQLGEEAFAGEIVITYQDATDYSEAECDVLFERDLSETEVEEVMDSVLNILSGEGSIAVFQARQLSYQGFSLTNDENTTIGEDETPN